MLVSRKKLGHDMIWMLEPITALLTEISKYPGLVILATNLSTILDEALERRLIAKVLFERPDQKLRLKIWRLKWPNKFPSQPTEEQLIALSQYDLSGAQIENAFLLWAGRLIRTEKFPSVDNLLAFLEKDWKGYFQG
jgi:AAA+ superfamily predicted ATPase